MRDTIKGVLLGAFVAAGVSVLLAQAPSWTAPRTWATDDLLTATQFNAQIRDNLLNIRGFAACAENGTTGISSALTVLYGDCRWAAGGVANNSVTQEKMADDAVGPAEMDPESATAGQVMLIGSGGNPAWQFPFEFPRTRSTRAVNNAQYDQDRYILTSTIYAGDVAITISASATFTLSDVTGSLGCLVRFKAPSILGQVVFTTNGAKTLTATYTFGPKASSYPISLSSLRRGTANYCTVDSGATLTLTSP